MRAKWKWGGIVLAFSLAAGLLVPSTRTLAQTEPSDRGCCVVWQNAIRLLVRESAHSTALTALDLLGPRQQAPLSTISFRVGIPVRRHGAEMQHNQTRV